MPSRVLYIAPFCFPNYDAGATRLTMLARALCMEGCRVELCGVGDEVELDGIICHTLNPHRQNKLLNWIAYRTLGWRAESFVRQHAGDFDAIVASCLPSAAIDRIKSLCSASGITFAVDCTEWYTPDEFEKGESDRAYLDHVRLLTEVIDPGVKVIAISSYLERFFCSKGCNVLRIPSVLDMEELTPDNETNSSRDRIRIMYAGSPGIKDSLWLILQSIASLAPEEQESAVFDVYGVDDRALLSLLPPGTQIPDCVHAHGRVPRESVLGALHLSDFTVLMRDPSQRFAQAGMPTKVTESLGAGVPVIANITSDLGDYLIDGETAFVVPEYTAEACAKTLARAIKSSAAKREAMREKARCVASAKLDYRVYAKRLAAFLSVERGRR